VRLEGALKDTTQRRENREIKEDFQAYRICQTASGWEKTRTGRRIRFVKKRPSRRKKHVRLVVGNGTAFGIEAKWGHLQREPPKLGRPAKGAVTKRKQSFGERERLDRTAGAERMTQKKYAGLEQGTR